MILGKALVAVQNKTNQLKNIGKFCLDVEVIEG